MIRITSDFSDSKWKTKIAIIIITVLYFLSFVNCRAQSAPDYFPLEVGNKWVFRLTHSESNKIITSTGFEVKGKNIINDTTYYRVKSRFFMAFNSDSVLLRKDSMGNIHIRVNDRDYMFFHVSYYPIDTVLQIPSRNGIVKIYRGSAMAKHSFVSSCFSFGGISFTKYENVYREYITLTRNVGPTYFTSNDCITFSYLNLRQFYKNDTNQLSKSFRVLNCLSKYKNSKLVLELLLDNDLNLAKKNCISLYSAKKGYLDFNIERDFSNKFSQDFNPIYNIEPLNIFEPKDTITLIISNEMEDIFSYKLDGNADCLAVGSSIDDFKYSFITPNTTGLEKSHDPIEFDLSQNYPNPFNPQTKIRYDLNKTGKVEIVIYSLHGQKIRTLINDNISAGSHEVIWNGKDDNFNTVSSGIYFCTMRAGDFVKTIKLNLLK